MYYLYLLKSARRNWHYLGFTADLKRRVAQHNAGMVKSTKSERPLRLIYYEAYLTASLAESREYELKNNSKKKERLFERLHINSGGVA